MLWIDLWWNLKLRAVVSSLKLKRDLNVTVVVEPKRLMGKQKLNGITHKKNCKYLRKISRNAFAKARFHYFSHLTPLPKFSLLVTPFLITFLESQHFWPIFWQGVSFRACFFFSSLTRNFLNTYSAIRNNSYNFSMATTWSVGNFCLQESSPLALGNMTPARSCIWVVEEKQWCLPCRHSPRPSLLSPLGYWVVCSLSFYLFWTSRIVLTC